MLSPPTIHVIDDDHAVRDSLCILRRPHSLVRERSTVACSPIWICPGSLALNFSTGFATESGDPIDHHDGPSDAIDTASRGSGPFKRFWAANRGKKPEAVDNCLEGASPL